MRHLLASLGCLALAMTCQAQAPLWRLVTPNTSPAPRHLHAMAYDSARQRTVLFGGVGTTSLPATWEWDGSNWIKINPTTSPPQRERHAMVYDDARQRTMLFGGWSSPNHLGDTWEWDGKTWTRLNLTLSPSPRERHAMAYHGARQRTILFGGWGGSYLGDTWEWNGRFWTDVTPTTSPSRRDGHVMAYDAGRQRTVLFGGWDGNNYLADTWEWDGGNWTKINPTTSPPGLWAAAMVYDAARQRMVLFGGIGARGRSADTWEWDGKNWTLATISTAPLHRYWHAMAYDAARQRTVLFGGSGNNRLYMGDTWEFGGPHVALTTDTSIVSTSGGTQRFLLDAGMQHGTRNYWIFGSVTGTTPGFNLRGLHFPLNPDPWTDITIAWANTSTLENTQGILNPSGRAQGAFHIPRTSSSKAIGLRFHHAFLVYDVQSNFHLVSNAVPLTLVAPSLRQVSETFATDIQLDKTASAGSWGSNKATFGAIGGDGILGEFDYTHGKHLGNNVWEWSTEGGTTIPVGTLDNKTHTITNGVFNFSAFVLPAGVTLNFVGKNPLQINVRGEMRILGKILLNGVDLKKDAHKGSNTTGEKGSLGGPGGGRGGNGADYPDGQSNKSNFNGQDGQDCVLPQGHAYAANVSTTGGPGSKQYPADGKQTSVKFSLFNVISAMVTPGGSGGGNGTAGKAGSGLWVDSNNKPHPTLNKEVGPASPPGTALGWQATKPTNANSLQHHQVGAAGGGGGGSHPMGAIIPGSGGTKVSYRSGRAGAGGGGAAAIRCGRQLALGSAAVIQAQGGSASGNLSQPFTDKEPCPGGGGAGGTIFFQVDGPTDMQGTVDASGGKGGILDDSPTFGDRVTVLGGDGGAGIIRMETVGTLNKSRLGTTTPIAAKDSDVQRLTDQDQVVGMRSHWYSATLSSPPRYLRYEIQAKVDGNPVVYSDDSKVGTLAARGATPLVFLIQGAQVRRSSSGAIEPIPNTIKPWRVYVGPFGSGSLDGDGVTGFRFTLLLDRTFGKTVEVQKVTVFFSI